MPNNNEQRHQYCTENTSLSVMQEHCDMNEIDLDYIPQEVKDRFIEACMYTPYDVSLDHIARETGLTRETMMAEQERRRVGGGVGVSLQGIREMSQEDRFRELLGSFVRHEHRQEPEELQAMPVYESITLDSAMAIPSHIEDFYASLDLSNRPRAVAYTPRAVQKKRPKRSERDMILDRVRSIGDKFPRPNFKDWSSKRELTDIVNDWYRSVEYREQWIFARREREGFNRRQVNQFSLDDVISRMNKRRNGHQLDSDNSKFYDWKLGGTDWILRLELFVHEQDYFLISRYIHKPSNVEIKYDVRYWSESAKAFKPIGSLISEYKNHPENFEMVFGSHDVLSGYYQEPYQEDTLDSADEWYGDSEEYDESDYEEEYSEEGDYEDSPF